MIGRDRPARAILTVRPHSRSRPPTTRRRLACRGWGSGTPAAPGGLVAGGPSSASKGPQKPPAGAQVAAQAAPTATNASYWLYLTGTMTSSGPVWNATMREEVRYHDNCPTADCPNQGIVQNQWIDISSYVCKFGCTIQGRADGVIGNGTKYLNGWENFEVDCDLNVMGYSAGCNAGHDNRLYFAAQGVVSGFHY